MQKEDLQILFETEDLIAINKPHGLLVHRTKIANDATEFAVQLVRDLIGQKVFPAHRLDRKTSGVLLFSKNNETNRIMNQMFQERKVKKTYEAIVRGFVDEEMTIDYPLKNEEKVKDAITEIYPMDRFELALPFGKFPTSRYSHVEVKPQTGRFHQIRKHLAHVFHPILGDRPHGCNKQNKLWKESFNMTTMMLHAKILEFEFPENNLIEIKAPYSSEFTLVLDKMRNENTHQQK